MAESNAVTVVESRRWVASRARGATLEIGIGGWPSLRFYPADVSLTGLDRQSKAVAKATRAMRPSACSRQQLLRWIPPCNHPTDAFARTVLPRVAVRRERRHCASDLPTPDARRPCEYRARRHVAEARTPLSDIFVSKIAGPTPS